MLKVTWGQTCWQTPKPPTPTPTPTKVRAAAARVLTLVLTWGFGATRVDSYKTAWEQAELQVRSTRRSSVPMAAHMLPTCERGVKPVRFSESVMEVLLHEARNGTDPRYENPHRMTLFLLLCLVLLLTLWNRGEKTHNIPGVYSNTYLTLHCVLYIVYLQWVVYSAVFYSVYVYTRLTVRFLWVKSSDRVEEVGDMHPHVVHDVFP